MLQKGDIIVGNCNNGYSITNEKALMLVLEKNSRGSIEVLVMAHLSFGKTGDCHWVEEREFSVIDINDYFHKYHNPYLIEDDCLNNFLNDYEIEMDTSLLYKNRELCLEPKVPYELSEEMRHSLKEEMKTLLTTYGYHPTDEGINIILNTWATEKADLIRLLEKHPNYNGRFQVVFDADYDREVNPSEIHGFVNWLYAGSEIEDSLLEDYINTTPFSYRECHQNRLEYESIWEIISSRSYITNINGLNEEEAKNNYYKWYELEKEIVSASESYGDRRVTRESYNRYLEYKAVLDMFFSYYNNTLTSDESGYINRKFPDLKTKKGQKTSRALNKLCTMLGINKIPEYNARFAKYSDAINPLTIKRYTILSVHPIDYLTMSFGNSWSTCMTIDKKNKRNMSNSYEGRYSGGTESYMLDSTSMVLYTVDKEYEGNEYELQPKIQRNIFHYGYDKLVQGRVYPKSNDDDSSNLYKRFRETVQKIISECKDSANSWLNIKGIEECDSVTYTSGCHYPDYVNFENCNVSYYNKEKNMKEMVIGNKIICPTCGKLHNRSNCIECEDCRY